MVLMRVRDVGDASDGRRARVILEDVEQRLCLAFATDIHEAGRLARVIGRARCGCNPVYEFIESVLGAFQVTITRVVLDDTGDRGISAFVDIKGGTGAPGLILPCYPPDALALALRSDAPIYATRQVLAHAVPFPSVTFSTSNNDLKDWLHRLTPKDF